MTNDDNSEGLFSIVQAKITLLESETKKTREPNNRIVTAALRSQRYVVKA